ncbi:MAG: acyltransferase [Clostridia bacterium]|nr:acyltransferase [Clostridia bacterium]
MNQTVNKKDSLLNDFICTVTFICSLMVVGIHQYNAGTLDEISVTALFEGFLAHGIFISAVPCFFILSGFLFFRNTGKINDVYKKQIKRIKSVLIPFLVWSCFYCMLNYAKKFVTGENIVFSPIYFIKEIVFYIHCFSLWYMFQLIVYIVLAPAIFLILKSKKISFILLILLCFIGLVYTPVISISVCGNERALFQVSFFAYYFLGCFAAKYFEPKKLINIAEKIPMSVYIYFWYYLELYSL